MHEFEFNLKKAQKDITIADHLMNVTHPLINDPKLLIAIIKKLHDCLHNLMLAVLKYDFEKKNIDSMPSENFSSALSLFAKHEISRFSQNYIPLIADVNGLVKEYDESSVTLNMKGKVFMYDGNYNGNVIDKEKIKEYIYKTKQFTKDAAEILKW